jgi:hypothetical protein
MTAITEMYSTRKQCLEILFDFLTEGPYLPEQNIIEPTVSRLIPWSITYWKRGLSGVPLHGSALDMNESHNIEVSSIFIAAFVAVEFFTHSPKIVMKSRTDSDSSPSRLSLDFP